MHAPYYVRMCWKYSVNVYHNVQIKVLHLKSYIIKTSDVLSQNEL